LQDRWYERLRGAAAASVILVLLLLGRGLLLPATSGGPGSAASAYLTNAYSTLELLAAGMRPGRSAEVIAETARRLIAERAAALASGADTSRLDAAIDAKVSPLLSNVTDKGAAAIEYVLGDLLSIQGPPAKSGALPGRGAVSRAQANGKVPPQAVAHPGRIVDRRSVPTPGAERNPKPRAQPHGDADPGAQRVPVTEHTRPDSGHSHSGRSGPGAQESAPPVLDAGPGPEAILTPAGRVKT
jgi:hypothetical protein